MSKYIDVITSEIINSVNRSIYPKSILHKPENIRLISKRVRFDLNTDSNNDIIEILNNNFFINEKIDLIIDNIK